MKNKRIGFIIILFICGFCTVCNAVETGSVYLESNQDTVEKGEKIEITVNVKNSAVAACNFSISFDETKWEYVSEIENANKIENNILFVWHDTTGGKSAKQGEIAKFKFKAKEDGLSTFTIDGEFYNSSGQAIKMDFQEKQVLVGKEEIVLQSQEEKEQIGEKTEQENMPNGQPPYLRVDNTNLEILAIENTLLYPPFDANETNYQAEVAKEVQNLNLFAVPENENAKVEINGINNLKEGENIVTIEVTAANGINKKKYQVQVYKRNAEEQNKYEEEQKEQIKKVEEAYKIEKLKTDNNSASEEEQEHTENMGKEQSNNHILIIGTVALLLVGVAGVGFILWKKRK